jgi:hypothetical protein
MNSVLRNLTENPIAELGFSVQDNGMPSESIQRVVRIDKGDLAELPAEWSDQERGRHLRRLFRLRGIEPHRLFRVEYYPHHQCWLLIQEDMPGASPAAAPRQPDGLFYRQVMAELRRAALTAFASHAARSMHFASHGSSYQLPPKPQELTPGTLMDLLGGPSKEQEGVHFTNEGGWQIKPSEN